MIIKVLTSTAKEFSCNLSGENITGSLAVYLDKSPSGLWVLSAVVEYIFNSSDIDGLDIFDRYVDDGQKITWSRLLTVVSGAGLGVIKLYEGHEQASDEVIEMFTIKLAKLIDGLTKSISRAGKCRVESNYRRIVL